MQIDYHKVVCLAYELHEENANGELLEIMDNKWPLNIFLGGGDVLPYFEKNLIGLNTGDSFEFILSPKQAYGEPREDLITYIPKSDLNDMEGSFQSLQPGDNLQLNASPPLLGRITKMSKEGIWLDCNHALAGKSLHFKGTVLYVRDATVDELIQKRYIEPDGVRF